MSYRPLYAMAQNANLIARVIGCAIHYASGAVTCMAVALWQVFSS